MNNRQLHEFSKNPVDINVSRSTFSRRAERLTSFDAGKLIPLYVSEILPGDTVKMNVDFLCRSLTPLTPVMDRAYIDIHFYFVPNRLVWNHWKEFMGENTAGPWATTTEYSVPQVLVSNASNGLDSGHIADYFGLPVKTKNLSFNALPFRGYALIWNEWYRDENVQSPVNITLGDTSVNLTNRGLGLPNDDNYSYSAFVSRFYVTEGAVSAPLPVAKFHDYFTSALPSPQKSADPVSIPLAGYAPVENIELPGSYFRPNFYDSKKSLF